MNRHRERIPRSSASGLANESENVLATLPLEDSSQLLRGVFNLVDSSGWLAFFADTKNAGQFAVALDLSSLLVVPTIVIYEVTKVLLREQGEGAAIIAQAHMQKGTIADLTTELATSAAAISLQNRIPMADSIIVATARAYGATIWTQDEHFKDLPQTRYFCV